MGCKGCKDKKRRFKKMLEDKKYTKEEIHFMKVCVHGVPHGYMCKGCGKVIEIPADAKLKPKDVVEKIVEEVGEEKLDA